MEESRIHPPKDIFDEDVSLTYSKMTWTIEGYRTERRKLELELTRYEAIETHTRARLSRIYEAHHPADPEEYHKLHDIMAACQKGQHLCRENILLIDRCIALTE